jgi:peptide/nickel transport system substrate-binding protein
MFVGGRLRLGGPPLKENGGIVVQKRSWLNYRSLLLVLIASLLVIVVACGGAATATPRAAAPQPTATAAPAVAQPAPTLAPSATAAPLPVAVPKLAKSDADLAREGALALAAKHGEKPRYGGKMLANDWEPIPFFDMHQTSFGGVFVITAPAYNGLLANSPYDPTNLEIIPDLARTWELSDGGTTVTFHLAEGVKWHDGKPFSSADVKYTIERIKDPPQGMVSPRGSVFKSVVASVEAPDPNTVVVKSNGVSPLLLLLFVNPWNVIIPKHISEVDPVNAMMTQVVGTGAFRLVGKPTATLWRYERNPDYFEKDLPYLDEIEYNIIQDPQAQAAALLTKKIYFNDATAGINFSPDLAKSVVDKEPGLVYTPLPSFIMHHLTMNATKAPFDDLRVRQAISEAVRRESLSELGPAKGTPGTGNHPLGRWALPKTVRDTLIGYGPNMDVRIAHAKQLLASYEAEKGKIDWSKINIQCSSNIAISCPNGEVIQQLLKKIDVNVALQPLDVTANRGNEVSGDYLMSSLGTGMNFDDPVDSFGQLFITKGGRWYQRSSVPELDALFQKQASELDFEKRRQLVWEMDKIAMNDSAYLILHWNLNNHVKWNFVKGHTSTNNLYSTNARMKYTWLDLPEANRSSR